LAARPSEIAAGEAAAPAMADVFRKSRREGFGKIMSSVVFCLRAIGTQVKPARCSLATLRLLWSSVGFFLNFFLEKALPKKVFALHSLSMVEILRSDVKKLAISFLHV
jgi:hypothetical protein